MGLEGEGSGGEGEGSGGKGGREVGIGYPPVHPLIVMNNVSLISLLKATFCDF